MTRSQSANLINKYHIPYQQDFFTLSACEVGRVLDAADEWKYRKPKHAYGSRGRYFFALLQRSIRDRAFSGFVHTRKETTS